MRLVVRCFFASAKQFCEVLKSIGLRKKIMIIRMRHVPFIDSTGLKNLLDALKILKETGTKIILSGVNETVFLDLHKGGIVNIVGEKCIFSTFDLAIEAAKMNISKVS